MRIYKNSIVLLTYVWYVKCVFNFSATDKGYNKGFLAYKKN